MNYYYKTSLTDTIFELLKIQERLYECIFWVAMAGELAEWSRTMEIGDAVKFDLDIFEACSDTNIQLLIKLLAEAKKTSDSLENINNLQL